MSVASLVGELKNSTIINSYISLYNSPIQVVDFSREINCTIWDCNSKIKNFTYFVLMSHISTAVIFCNLQNTASCDRIDYWKQIIDKYRPGILTVVAGTLLNKDSDQIVNQNQQKNKKIIERNTINVLQWCVEHGDIPFFNIDLADGESVKDMYNSIFVDRLKKIKETLP